MTIDRLDGYSAELIGDPVTHAIQVTVRQASTGRAWTGTRDTIEEAIALVSRIVAEQTEKGKENTDGV